MVSPALEMRQTLDVPLTGVAEPLVISCHLLARRDRLWRGSNLRIVTQPPCIVDQREDAFGNDVVVMSLNQPADRLRITATAEFVSKAVTTRPVAAIGFGDIQRGSRPMATDLVPFDPQISLGDIDRLRGEPVAAGFEAVFAALHEKISYRPGVTTTQTSAYDAWRLGYGVCQDYSHILLSWLRQHGVDARYAAGVRLPEQLTPAPRAALPHAWVEIPTGEDGWLAVDPTFREINAANRITLCVGRDYQDARPAWADNDGLLNDAGWRYEIELQPLPE